MKPTHQRIDILDIWRGFAIFGIFFANIHAMHSSQMNMDAFEAQFAGALTTFAHRFDQLFIYGKFFTIFSFLFGLGIALQALKITDTQSKLFFWRRMLALYCFGLLHISLLWSGDVLHVYAILGILSLLVFKLHARLLLILSALILVFPFYNQVVMTLFNALSFSPFDAIAPYSVEEIKQLQLQGSVSDMMQLRWDFYLSDLPMMLTALVPKALAMFLLGLYVGKKGYLSDLPGFLLRIGKPVIAIAIIANLYRLFFLFGLWDLAIWRIPEWRDVFIYIMGICEVITGLFYLWLIGWLYSKGFLIKVIRPCRYVGKTALTNYLLHSVVAMFVFTGIGLGLYESLSPIQLFGMVWVTFICQIALSKLWLKYFSYGPMEWLWRCLSYWRFFPLKRS